MCDCVWGVGILLGLSGGSLGSLGALWRAAPYTPIGSMNGCLWLLGAASGLPQGCLGLPGPAWGCLGLPGAASGLPFSGGVGRRFRKNYGLIIAPEFCV